MVVQLIAKDKLEKLQYEGKCKLLIDSVSKLLLVEPFIEEYKMISAMFKWKFVTQKNILFVFAEHDFQDFALIFDDPKKSNKVYEILVKKGATPSNKKLINERFLFEFFTDISANTESCSKLKEIFFKWIEFFDGKEKEEYIQILKIYNIYDLIFPFTQENERPKSRKRKANDCSNSIKVYEKSNEFNAKKSKSTLKKIIEPPNFEVLKYVINGNSRAKLSIFPTFEKKYCYEYFWKKSNNRFVCYACQFLKKHVSAKIIQKFGKDVVMLNGTQHVCELQKYKEIIEKPNFEIVSYERFKICYKRIIMFLDPSRIFCYEYVWKSQFKTYYCCGCMSKKLKNGANICQNEYGTEFVMLKSNNHICEPRKYEPEKYGEKEIIEAENFKIYKEFRNGKNKSKLVVFASSDKSTCYEYYWHKLGKKFLCIGCIKKKNRNYVTAELFLHGTKGNYLKLSKKRHTCEPREFKPEKFDISKNEIVASSNFRIFKYKNNGVQTSKLIVFCETNKNLCYEFWWNQRSQFYQCTYCPMKNSPFATVCQNEDSKDYLILNNGEHVCNLREFNPEKYRDDIALDKTMYKCSTTLRKTAKILAIFSTQEKQFYYKFVFNNHKKHYYCSRCYYSNTYITASFQTEGKENEVLYVSSQKHICEPFKYSILVENSVVKFPNFLMMKRNTRGKIHQHLVVFINEEKTECYEYTWDNHTKTYRCYPCKNSHKINVYAKIFKNNENEERVELCKNEHKCQPIKFVAENKTTTKIVKEPDFKLYEILFRGKNIKKVTIFDSKNKSMGYVYTYNEIKKKYVCSRCITKRKYVTAGIKQQENGQNYVELNETEHVCELQKL